MMMGTTIKGIYKGIKRRFVKKREMEIGSPTDVKHVSHIGLGDSSTRGPSWMSQFKTGPEFTTSIGDNGSPLSPCSSSEDSCISRDQQSPTMKLSIETETSSIPTPRKRANKNKALSTSSTIPKKREKRNKAVSTSSTLSIEIPNADTPKVPKKRKKKNSTGTSSPSPRSSKHSKTKANLVQVE